MVSGKVRRKGIPPFAGAGESPSLKLPDALLLACLEPGRLGLGKEFAVELLHELNLQPQWLGDHPAIAAAFPAIRRR
jgi:hypothetical protein